MIFKENNKAIFMQIADKICDDILTSALVPGLRIPSVRAYAAEIQVNANTVMRAYEYLASRGVVYNRRGIGFFVASDAVDTVERMRREEFVEGELHDVFDRLRIMGISADRLKEMYANFLSHSNQQ